jgi:hypothetical protein
MFGDSIEAQNRYGIGEVKNLRLISILGYYLKNIIFLVMLISIMEWAVFFLDPLLLDSRLSIGVTLFLAAVRSIHELARQVFLTPLHLGSIQFCDIRRDSESISQHARFEVLPGDVHEFDVEYRRKCHRLHLGNSREYGIGENSRLGILGGIWCRCSDVQHRAG